MRKWGTANLKALGISIFFYLENINNYYQSEVKMLKPINQLFFMSWKLNNYFYYFLIFYDETFSNFKTLFPIHLNIHTTIIELDLYLSK